MRGTDEWPPWKKAVWFVAVPGLVAFLVGVAVSRWVPNTEGAVLAMTIGAVGIIFFVSLMFLSHNLAGGSGLTDFDVRTAIAGAVTVVYLTVLPILVFSAVEPSPAATRLLDAFTTLASVVAGFYFGGTALVDFGWARGQRGDGGPAPSRQGTTPPAPPS
jgi:hypothetical protein